jgi:hypothetical protein
MQHLVLQDCLLGSRIVLQLLLINISPELLLLLPPPLLLLLLLLLLLFFVLTDLWHQG